MEEKERIKRIIEALKKKYPNTTALNFSNPLELLVATMLSAQTTDKLVNKITQNLFKKYKNAEDYANANEEEFAKDIKGVNFYKTKAKNIIKMAKVLVEKYNGKVPDSMEKLLILPGVARKTANVVLAKAFNKSEGIVVDTHVKRISFRLGLTNKEKPEEIEKDLMQKIPKEEWNDFPFRLIWLGRDTCTAKKAYCEKCVLNSLCPKIGVKAK